MSLHEFRMPSLRDKLEAQALADELVEKQEEKDSKRSKIIKKQSKKK